MMQRCLTYRMLRPANFQCGIEECAPGGRAGRQHSIDDVEERKDDWFTRALSALLRSGAKGLDRGGVPSFQ